MPEPGMGNAPELEVVGNVDQNALDAIAIAGKFLGPIGAILSLPAIGQRARAKAAEMGLSTADPTVNNVDGQTGLMPVFAPGGGITDIDPANPPQWYIDQTLGQLSTQAPTPAPSVAAAPPAPSIEEQLASARSNALDLYLEELANRGLDPNADRGGRGPSFLELGNQAIDARIPSAPYAPDFNPEGLFDTSFPASILDAEQNRLRSSFTDALSNANVQFDPTFGDEILNQFAMEQRQPVDLQIGNAAARGNLSPEGVTEAFGALEQQMPKALDTLGSVRSDLLAQFNADIDNILGEGRSAASSFELGQSFDPQTYIQQASAKKDELASSFGDQLSALVGQNQLFSAPDALQVAGKAQGLINIPSGVPAVLANRQKKSTQPRGLGTKGAF